MQGVTNLLSALMIPPCTLVHTRPGLHAVKEMSAGGYESVHFETQDKYYALAACAALLKYVEHTHSMVFAARSLRMTFRGSNETTFIGTCIGVNLLYAI